ncbi:MAG: hypothetical protein ABH870_00645 [bacterium]
MSIKKLALISLFIVCCIQMAGCVGINQFTQGNVLSGKVVDTVTGDGIGDVDIKVVSEEKGETVCFAKTQPQGMFKVAGLKKQKYRFICKKEGIVPERIKVVDLTKPEEDTALTITVTVGGLLKGRMVEKSEELDSSGKPLFKTVSSVKVRLLTENNTQLKEDYSAPTGEFTFPYIEIDTCKLRIEHGTYFWLETEPIAIEKGKAIAIEDIVIERIPDIMEHNPEEYQIIRTKTYESSHIGTQ